MDAPAPPLDAVRFDERGLVPAIVQQHDTGEVLMLAWMTAGTLAETLERGETVFWSRSRGERWHKGGTSGNVQAVVEVVADCDGDTVLVRVDQRGPGGAAHGVACHTGARTCFHRIVGAAVGGVGGVGAAVGGVGAAVGSDGDVTAA